MLILCDFIGEILQNKILKNPKTVKKAKRLQTHTIVFILEKSQCQRLISHFFIFLILVSQTDRISVISLSSLPPLLRKLTFSPGKLVKTERPNASNYDRRFSGFFHPLIFLFPLEEPYQICFLPYGIFLKYCEEQPTVATQICLAC